jgi:hypothetical protein
MVCAMDRRGVSIWSSMLYRSNCRALNVIVAKRILIVFLFVSLGGFDPRTAALNDEGKPVIVVLIENSSPLVLLRNDLMPSRFGWSDYMYFDFMVSIKCSCWHDAAQVEFYWSSHTTWMILSAPLRTGMRLIPRLVHGLASCALLGYTCCTCRVLFRHELPKLTDNHQIGILILSDSNRE